MRNGKKRKEVKMKKWFLGCLAVAAAGLMVACGTDAEVKNETESVKSAEMEETVKSSAEGEETAGETEGEQQEVTILVAAAASLKYSYDEQLIPMFTEKYPWIHVEGTYDSSGKLQTQIEEGMEADIFMSAAMKQMNDLEKNGYVDEEDVVKLLENKIVLVVPQGIEEGMEADIFMSAAMKQMNDLEKNGYVDEEDVVKLLENKIVLVVPQGEEDGFTSFEDITKADSIALGDPESVPVGQYAKESLTNLGIWEEVEAKTSFGTNVTEVLNWVAEGSADAGIVYATDAATTDQVSVVAEAPASSLGESVIYPVAMINRSGHEEAAQLFVEFLQSEEAMAVFEEYGFSPAS